MAGRFIIKAKVAGQDASTAGRCIIRVMVVGGGGGCCGSSCSPGLLGLPGGRLGLPWWEWYFVAVGPAEGHTSLRWGGAVAVPLRWLALGWLVHRDCVCGLSK